MKRLNLPEADFRIMKKGERSEIFDIVRKKFVALTSEEWVRQNFVNFLIKEKNVPASLIGIEVPLKVNRLQKRGDIVIYGRSGKPCLIVECKAPEIAISQEVFEQVARYNMTLQVKFLVVTNGLNHYACFIDREKSEFHFLKEIPAYEELEQQLISE